MDARYLRSRRRTLKISERATIVFPYHRALDGLEEARLKDKKYGSTLRGIAPVYSDKYQKKTIMMGELLYPEYLKKRLAGILEWKNLIDPERLRRRALQAGGHARLVRGVRRRSSRPFLCDTPRFLYEAEKSGKNIMFEAQLGALRDIDFGIFSLHVLLLVERGLRLRRRGYAGQPCGPYRRHREGLLHLRRRRPVHSRVVRRGGREALRRGGRRIRRRDRPSAPRRPDRPGRHALWRAAFRARPRSR